MSDHEDCRDLTILSADRTFVASNGGRGDWTLKGNLLIFEGPGGRATLEIARIDDNRVEVTDEHGTTGISYRCGAAAPAVRIDI